MRRMSRRVKLSYRRWWVNMAHILDGSIVSIHQALVEKRITPLELTQEALRRAKENDDNAFECILEKEALQLAASLTEPDPTNVLWGIPYVLKDNFSTKGIETTAGSDILKGYRPLYDATVVQKFQDVQAILIGKATLDELAMGGTGMTGHKGIQTNPYDPTHSRQIGGSSSGSAVAVSAGIVPFSIGSDTGDSVRKPASYAGLVGFKPTWGRISRYGLFPFAPSLDHVAYFTRTVEDADILLSVLSGVDTKDATTLIEPYVSKTVSLKGKKIAILKPVFASITNSHIRDAFLTSVEGLKAQGIVVELIDFDEALLKAIYPTYMTISCAEATSNNANLDGIKFGPGYEGKTYQDVMMQARTQGFSELIKRRFVIGSFVLMRENQEVLFLRAQKIRRKIVDALHTIYQTYDGIYLPAAPSVAPPFKTSSDRLSNEYLIADSHLALGNFAGLPSLTIPLGFENGLPFGANIMTSLQQEATCFAFASLLESIIGLKNLIAPKESTR